jgi:lipopolysaccharide transport system ATP-binding protein
MSSAIITVEGLSKAYRIGLKEEIPDTLVGAATSWLKAPGRNFQRLRKLNTFGASGDGEQDIIWALRDVSFQVAEGEVLGIIGRNGAGKSTLLKILSRITEPTRGRAVIRGRVSSLLEVGTGFHQELSGRENIYMNGTILGMRKREIDRKLDEIIAFSGVEKFLDTPIKRYSSGMKVRLAFSVAAHLEPEILIIDEVLAVGDAEFQRKCLGKMKDVARGGRTVLFVSHQLASMESLCTTGMELREGRVVLDGDIQSVVSHYRHSVYDQMFANIESAFRRTRYFKDVYLANENGDPTNFIPLGGSFDLRLVFHDSVRLDNATIGVGVDSVMGQRMMTVHTPNSSAFDKTLRGPATRRCRIPTFPLAPGEYCLKLVIAEGPQQLEVLDGVVPFTVIEADTFSEGRRFHRGVCVAPSRWSEVD